jgi:superfamily I DNA/RNA helicase
LFAASLSSSNAIPGIEGLGLSERRRLAAFMNAARCSENEDQSVEAGTPAVYGVVLFPNASHEKLQQAWSQNPVDGSYWLGDEYTSSEKLAACLRKLSTGGLAERQLARLRSHFSPESVVPPRFSPRAKLQRNVNAGASPLLLDYEQEAWSKNRLRLSDEAAAVAETQAPYGEASLVTGVAGSGKSLVLLFRACTQAKLHPRSRALVLTHNKALRYELETRFGELGRPPNVEWHTFFSWLAAVWPASRVSLRRFEYEQRDELIAEASRFVGIAPSSQWLEFLRDEIDWMQDREVTKRTEYLMVERIGRGVRLTAQQREQVHAIYERYSALLDMNNGEDWSGRALRFWREIESGQAQLPAYDYIYVDEAQFFAPVWLRTLRSALKPTGRLLLAADPTQGFLKRRQSWVACGLDLRGRSTRLRKCYRNTRPILEFAAHFYRSRLSEEDEADLNLPDQAEFQSAEPGERPKVIRLTSRQDEVTRVINEVHSYLGTGGKADHVLVLVALGLRTHAVVADLARAFGAHAVVSAKDTSGRGKLRVCSIDAATGLESPIVFIIGAAELLEREDDLQMSADQKDELRRDNTRRLYMGFTRAGVKLFVTWVGKMPPYIAEKAELE